MNEQLGWSLVGTPAPYEGELAGWPEPLLVLLRTWGPGRIAGRFDMLVPDDPRFAAAQAVVRGGAARNRGYWTAISDERWSRITVFALGDGGDALAFESP